MLSLVGIYAGLSMDDCHREQLNGTDQLSAGPLFGYVTPLRLAGAGSQELCECAKDVRLCYAPKSAMVVGRGQKPVILVGWNDAQRYVAWVTG